eukprot:scaffold12204_cov61-Phaeocystis_antarctica.AAC.15
MSGVNSGSSCERNQSRLKVVDVWFVSPLFSSTSVCTRFPVSSALSEEQLGTLLKHCVRAMEATTRNRLFIHREVCRRGCAVIAASCSVLCLSSVDRPQGPGGPARAYRYRLALRRPYRYR